MTYCLAWRKENKGYIIADSAISIKIESHDENVSSFGERQGLYEKYFVSEGTQKIVVLSENLTIAYSGNEQMAKEAIENISNMYGYFKLDEIFKNLELEYQNLDCNLKFQLIVLVGAEDVEILHFNCINTIRVDSFVDIGSGREIERFSSTVKEFIYNNDELPSDTEEYLAAVIAFIQGISIKHGLFRFGVGGTFFGQWMDSNSHWCKDIEYLIYDDDIDKLTMVNVISRYNCIFAASDYSGKMKYFFNRGTDSRLEDGYVMESIRKILYTSSADYLVMFSKRYNVVYFNTIYKWTQFKGFRKWIRRKTDSTDIAMVFDPFYRMMLKSDENFHNDIPIFYSVASKKVKFIPREEFLTNNLSSNIPDDIGLKFDYDMSELFYIDKSKYFENNINLILKYKNIILIDFYFFCEILKEKFDLYKMSSDEFNKMHISKMVTEFFPQIASNDYNDYGLFFVKKEDDVIKIHEQNIEDWLKDSLNCYVINCKNMFLEEYNKIAFELIKNYYFNEKFYLLDKLIFCCDNEVINELITYFSPEYNMENMNPDILFIRNMNGLTKMDGRFRYVVIDYAIAFMFNLNLNQIGLLESGLSIELENLEDRTGNYSE